MVVSRVLGDIYVTPMVDLLRRASQSYEEASVLGDKLFSSEVGESDSM